MFPDQAERSFSKILPVLDKRASQLKYPWRLRCLPLVYIIGVAKCGTSDLFYTLATHPQITIGATKEPFFWDWGLWKTSMPNTLLDYLNLYDQAAERIRQLTTTQPQNGMSVAYNQMVTMDGSVNTLFAFGGRSVLPGIVGHSEPRYIAAHMIKNLTPKSDIKVILIIRNPTERLFSSYVFFNTVTHPNNISREEFHRLASASIRSLNQCFVSRNLSACLYDKSVIKTYKTVDVHAGVYYGFIKDWITVFPHMRIVRLEDYKFNRQDIIKDIIQYIGLDPFHNKLSESTKHVGKGPKQTFKMLPQTKKMLDDFYRPFNKRLADFMGNEKFLFET
jgi:N-acetylgalactosamine 4-sulfate 6-O-sulfotransferase